MRRLFDIRMHCSMLPVMAQTHHLHTEGSEGVPPSKDSCSNPDCKAFFSGVNDLLSLPPTHIINKQRESPRSALLMRFGVPESSFVWRNKRRGKQQATKKRTVVFFKINRPLPPTSYASHRFMRFLSLLQLPSEHSPRLSECWHVETNNRINAYVQFRVTA